MFASAPGVRIIMYSYPDDGALGRDSVLKGCTGLGTNRANEMNFMNHAPCAGSLARAVDQQSNALPLSYGRPLYLVNRPTNITAE